MTDGTEPQPEPWGNDPEQRLGPRQAEFTAGTSWSQGDDVRLRKWVETDAIRDDVTRQVGSVETEHASADEVDDGEVHELSDGTLSIPVFEEQIVVTRRTVVRERILLRRQIVAETVEVKTEVRREEFELTQPDGSSIEVQHRAVPPFPGSAADPRRRAR